MVQRFRIAARRFRSALAPLAAILAIAVAMGCLSGCEIEEPALPTFTTQIAVPLGMQDLSIAELVADQDFLHSGSDSTLAFHLDGDTTIIDLEVDLSVDLDAVEISVETTSIVLPASPPLNFGFSLVDIYPGAGSLPPGPVSLPAFDFDLTSGEEDLVNIVSANVTSGTLSVTLVNDLPVPVSGPSPPAMIAMQLLDSVSGDEIALLSFPFEIAPDGTAIAEADLSGSTLGDHVIVTLVGGSPGGYAADGLDPDDGISMTVEMSDLVVDASIAILEEQSFVHTDVILLPEDTRLVSATLSDGALNIVVDNEMPLPCSAVISFTELRDSEGMPLDLVVEIPAGGTAETHIDLEGATIASGDESLISELEWSLEVLSPGSDGEFVTIVAGQQLNASLAATTMRFAEIRGSIPEYDFALDPLSETIDLPDELDGLRLAAATLTVEIINRTGISGTVEAELVGVTASGDRTEVSILAQIAADTSKDARTVIIIDETNSNLAELLSTMPETFLFSGAVHIGGGEEIGTLRTGDSAQVSWRLDAPLRLTVSDSRIDREPEPLGLDENLREQLDGHVEASEFLLEISNHFPFGVEISLLVGDNPLTLLDHPELEIGPLAITGGVVNEINRWVETPTTSVHRIALSDTQIGIITSPNAHTALIARIPGTDGEEVVVRMIDYINVVGAITAEILVSDD